MFQWSASQIAWQMQTNLFNYDWHALPLLYCNHFLLTARTDDISRQGAIVWIEGTRDAIAVQQMQLLSWRIRGGAGRAWWACCTKSTKLKGFESRAVRPLLNHARSSGSLCAFHTAFGDHCALLKRVFGGDCPFKHQNLREVTAQKCQNCCIFCWKVCSS